MKKEKRSFGNRIYIQERGHQKRNNNTHFLRVVPTVIMRDKGGKQNMIPTLYEPFRHWSEKGSVYILSDLHFDDADCKFMSPDWITPDEQLSVINGIVMKNDTFICLWDVGKPDYIKDIKARKKILILGNHDAKGAYNNYFDEIYTGPLFIAEKILLSHEPVYGLPWCLNIHGHDHNNIEPYKDGCKHINLAANVCGYTPINLGKIIKEGVLADVPSIHRMTIDRQVERGKKNDIDWTATVWYPRQII